MEAYRYGFQVSWSDEDEAFVATCPDFPNLSAFGVTPSDALTDAQEVLEMFIEEFKADDLPLPAPTVLRPYSGQLRLRMPASVHGRLADCAGREGVSLNALINTFVVEGLAGRALDERIGRLEESCEVIEAIADVMARAPSSDR